eukprot:11415293-Alexandrium_andersonii.AAC.1
MPHGRILARIEDLGASLVVLAQRGNDFPTQDTAQQHGSWDCQGAQGMIQRDNLGLRSAVRHSRLLLRGNGKHLAGVRAH